MRKFNVNVNGKSYEVEVQEVGGAVESTYVAAPVAKAATAAPAPAAAVGKGTPINAQTPGLVKKLCFANGASVKTGDTVIMLEAMKMDLPIKAANDGVITYNTNEGANVDTGAVLCTIA